MRDPQDTTWQDRALCAGDADRHSDNYFPEGDSFAEILPALEVRRQRETEAKKVCSRCDVRSECLVYALANGEEHGIWGGHNPAERADLLELGAASGE